MAQHTDRLDLLVNNAGIGTAGGGPRRRTSVDGNELRFAVNYLAGFLLTHRLLPLLKASAPARIVNVSSAGQQAIDFADVMLIKDYSGTRAYCQSKLAQILFTVDLARELEGTGVTVNALHPSTYMNTTMVRQAGMPPASRVEDGADAILNLALSPALDGRSGPLPQVVGPGDLGRRLRVVEPSALPASVQERLTLPTLTSVLRRLGGRWHKGFERFVSRLTTLPPAKRAKRFGRDRNREFPVRKT